MHILNNLQKTLTLFKNGRGGGDVDGGDGDDDGDSEAPNDTTYKRWSCHSGLKPLCKLCRTSPPLAMGARFTVLGMPAMRTRWMASTVAHKSGRCRDQSRSDNFKQ